MKPPASLPPLKVVGIVKRAKSGGFYSGDVINITVKKQLKNLSYRVLIGEKEVTVLSERVLVPGKKLKVQAYWVKGKLYLKIISESVSGPQLNGNDFSLPQSQITRNILNSFYSSSMPIESEKISILYRFLKKNDKLDFRIARLLSLAVDKGLFKSYSFYEELINALFRDTGGGRDRRQKKGKSDFEEVNAKIIKEKILGGNGGGGDALKLFNHLKAVHDNWMILPFNFETDRGPINGTIRCKTDDFKKGEGLFKIFSIVVVAVEEVKGTWFFRLKGREKVLMDIFSPGGETPANLEILKTFMEKYRNIGLSLDDNIEIKDTSGFDGFNEVQADKYKKIDTMV